MDTNLTAWIAAGGPWMDDPHAERDRAQLHAFRESQRRAKHGTGLRERLAHFVRPVARPEPACCLA
jgi:hypothetical protein